MRNFLKKTKISITCIFRKKNKISITRNFRKKTSPTHVHAPYSHSRIYALALAHSKSVESRTGTVLSRFNSRSRILPNALGESVQPALWMQVYMVEECTSSTSSLQLHMEREFMLSE